MTNTASKIEIGKFEKLSNGNECDGKPVLLNGKEVARIYRTIEWTRGAGMSERYTGKIRGYRVECWVSDEDQETPAATLAEAHAVARRLVAQAGPPA